MGAFLGLIGGIKGVIIIALVLALGGWAASLKYNTSKAIAQRDAAIVQRDEAGVQRDKAISAAKANEETIAKLQQEKEFTNQALNDLQSAKNTNRSNTVTREVIIQNQAGLPANGALAAPILGAIVDAVQIDRERRRPSAVTPPRSVRLPSTTGIRQ
jgi:hypothetical protein